MALACRDAGFVSASIGIDCWWPHIGTNVAQYDLDHPSVRLPDDAREFSFGVTISLNRQHLWLKEHGVKVGGKLQYTFKLDDEVDDERNG